MSDPLGGAHADTRLREAAWIARCVGRGPEWPPHLAAVGLPGPATLVLSEKSR
ncbi:hypothetical protein [Spongiactinospora gelatinilytica]|uniref:hypothetical protein n=1 Tax=Spongiactinospora gelatinilytica TaxID=2666298 RepID=UPI001F2BADC3|nr:hypothetical protein [Spongiactinospora gelatinilytica]